MSYVTCALSNIRIKEGERVQFVILKEERDMYTNFGVYPSHLIYMTEMFRPFTFPIEATYDGYGRLTNIKRTKNIELLEKRFSLTIEEILNIVTSTQNKDIEKLIPYEKDTKDYSLLKDLSGMFMLDTIYQKFVVDKIDMNDYEYADIVKCFNLPYVDNWLKKYKDDLYKTTLIFNKDLDKEEFMKKINDDKLLKEYPLSDLTKVNSFVSLTITNLFNEDIFESVYDNFVLELKELQDDFIRIRELKKFMHYQSLMFRPAYRGEEGLEEKIEFHKEVLRILEEKQKEYE